MRSLADLQLSDTFTSNNGRGPYRARILAMWEDKVEMERWMSGKPGVVRFSLPRRFLESSACGWKRDA